MNDHKRDRYEWSARRLDAIIKANQDRARADFYVALHNLIDSEAMDHAGIASMVNSAFGKAPE